MGSRDRDLKKLKGYVVSRGLNLKVRPYGITTGAAEYIENESITLFTDKRTNKTEIILSLLHELGHHLDFKSNPSTDFENFSLGALTSGKMHGRRDDLTKEQRKAIYDMESAGIGYMTDIHKELELEIPLWRVKYQQMIDLYHYKVLYQSGRWPTKDQLKELRKLRAEFKEKYGKRKN